MMDLIVSWACSAIAEAMEWVVETLCMAFGYDISTFNETFDFAATAYDIILSVALPLALILAAWSLIVFFWKGAEKAPSTPIRTVINLVVAIAFIYYGNNLFEAILDFCQYPYNAIINEDAVKWGADLAGAFAPEGLIADAFAHVSSVVYLLMLLLIGISFIKLLLEIVERYVVTFVLMYLSPLAAATLASGTTSGIYKKFFTMFVSQCVLIFLDAWCLKMAVSGLSLSSSGNHVIVSLLLCFAFLRISTRMDSYLNQIGLNSAITGGGMGAEIMAVGATLLKRDGNGGGSYNGAGGAGSKILGASKSVGTWMSRHIPASAVGKAGMDAVSGAVKGGSEAYRSGHSLKDKIGGAFKGAASGASQGLKNSDNRYSNRIGKHNTEEKVPGINSKTGRAGMVATGNYTHIGYRNELNNELVTGAKASDGSFDNEKENANISAWANNQHLATDAFSHMQGSNQTVTESSRISAIAEGLGAGKHSKEVAEFINAGYGRDGAQNINYRLDATGIHGEYDVNGYRHKTDIVNHSQYDKLTTQERSGFEKMTRTNDGKQYFVRSTKTQLEKPVTEANSGKAESSADASGESIGHVEQSSQ